MLDLKNAVRDLLSGILNFIYPPLCLVCSKEIESGLVCEQCIQGLDSRRLEVCPQCGWPIDLRERNHQCQQQSSLNRVKAFGLYATPLKELIHHLKYSNKRSLAKILGRKMGADLNSDSILKQADFLVPIPLHPARKRDRGYNQSELLACEISQYTGIPMLDCLKRKKNTKAQVTLTVEQRLQNVVDAFIAKPNFDLKDKRIILIDDVYTTGATLNAAAQAVLNAGAAEVYGLCTAWA